MKIAEHQIEMPKKIYIRTFGCQMNVRDSEFVVGILLDSGFALADSFDSADVILFNSCSVRKHAEDRLFSNISDLKDLKKTRPNLVIGLIGCTAQNYKNKALTRAPLIDLVCGPGNEEELPFLINDVMQNGRAIVATDKVDEKRQELFPSYRAVNFKTYISISEGCDNYCSYCRVPYVRGKERSRRYEDIRNEAESVASRGCREITLLGQNVNSYKDAGCDFVKLLEKMNKINGIERIRFMTSHPKDASAELFKAMAGLDNDCQHLHLPMQSGSDRILELMNRGYTAGRYVKLIEEYRKFVPGGSITTDIVVGFPSETEGDFQKTTVILKTIMFDNAFIFKYSPRPPAKAAELADDVSEEAKTSRIEELLKSQKEISLKRNEPMKGRIVEALVDGKNKKTAGVLSGRTRANKTVVFSGDESLIGTLIKVEIESACPYNLKGRSVGKI